MTHLYIILLEDKRLFLHTSTRDPTDKYNILLECELMYSYTNKYKPIRIQDSTIIRQDSEIDFFVKKYMKRYGIENIRGGSYCDEHISDAERMVIINEQNTTIPIIEVRCEGVRTVLAEYADIEAWPPQQIQDELNKLTLIYDKFKNESTMLYKLSNFNNIKIDRSIFEDLKWIGIKCIQQISPSVPFLIEREIEENLFYTETPSVWDNIVSEINQQYVEMDSRDWLKNNCIKNHCTNIKRNKLDKNIICKYEYIVRKIQALYSIFSNNTDIECKYEPKIHIYSPNTLFDTFIYHANYVDDWTPYYNRLEKYINICEYISYCIINKITEYEFDVKSYLPNFEEITSYKRRYLQQFVET
jgi:hypothetical protein